MSPLRSLRTLRRGNWLAVFACVVVSAVLGLVFFLIIDGAEARQDGVRQAEAQARQAIDSRQAASRRIDILAGQVRGLSGENGRLAESVAALAEQVRQMGGRPVASVAASPSRADEPDQAPTRTVPSPSRPAAVSPRPTPIPQPSARPSPSRQPSPRPSPSPSCRLPLPGPCLLR